MYFYHLYQNVFMVSFSDMRSSSLLPHFVNLTNITDEHSWQHQGRAFSKAHSISDPWFYNSKVPPENFCDWLFYSTDPVTHFCCCDLSRIHRHYGACHLVVLPLEKEESKEEQLSSTQSFMGLCPGAKRWTRRLLHSRELSISHPWEAPKHPRGTIMMCKDRKVLGNPGDPLDSVFWPKPELM